MIADAAAATYVMAAAVSTFLHMPTSSPCRICCSSRSLTARLEASNSTGNVTSWNSTARENTQYTDLHQCHVIAEDTSQNDDRYSRLGA